VNDKRDSERFRQAVARFDAINAEDPNVETIDGVSHSKELLYARRMTEWLDKLFPDASEPLRLAARCQHIKRWHIPRITYPLERQGYHRWRTELAKYHAETAGQVLREVGYDPETISRVQSLLRKERLKADTETQALEDVICLVFLEHYFEPFAEQQEEQKLIGILRRTWAKMSPRGQSAALALSLRPDKRQLIEKALG
jgi:hypothetical protein